MFSAFSDYGILAANLYGVESSTTIDLYKNITDDIQAFGVFPLLLRPRSRGFIKLKSANPDEAPVIVPNYFENPRDLQVLVRYFHFLNIFLYWHFLL